MTATTADFTRKLTKAEAVAAAFSARMTRRFSNFASARSGSPLPGLDRMADKLGEISFVLSGTKPLISPNAGLVGLIGGAAALHFLNSSLESMGEAEKAADKLDAVLNSTGHAAGLSSAEIENLAKQLQQVSIFGDDATISAAGLLASFTNVKGNIFRDALKTAQDMAAFFEGDLNTSVRQLGKALNDPVRGITQLRKVGVSLSADQEAQIKKFAALGQTVKAQEALLGALNERFGGQAAAAVGNYAGKVTQLAEAFGDLKESIGGLAAPGATGALDSVKSFVEGLSGAQAETIGQAIEIQAEKTPFLSQKELGDEIERNRLQQVESLNKMRTLADRIRARGVGESEGFAGAFANVADANQIKQLRTDFQTLEIEGSQLRSRLANLRRLQTSTGPSDLLAKGGQGIAAVFKQIGGAIVDMAGEADAAMNRIDSGFQQLEANARNHIKAFESAKEIIESTKTPLEEFEEQLKKIENLTPGFLNPNQARRGVSAAARMAIEGLHMPDFAARPSVAAFGTQEAFAAITAHTSPKINKGNELLEKILEQTKEEANNSDDLVRSLTTIERQVREFLDRTDPKKPSL